MIDNSDHIGNFVVTVIANQHSVANFQCPSVEDAIAEVQRIKADRDKRNLPTTKATARKILSREKRRGFNLGEPIDLLLPQPMKGEG